MRTCVQKVLQLCETSKYSYEHDKSNWPVVFIHHYTWLLVLLHKHKTLYVASPNFVGWTFHN